MPVTTDFVTTLGLEVESVSAERASARLIVGEQHLQPFGVVHGGVYAAIGETLASLGAHSAVQAHGDGMAVVGLENHTSFLRTVGVGATVVAEAVPVHSGRRVQLWAVTMTDAATGRGLATSTVRLLVVDPTTLPR